MNMKCTRAQEMFSSYLEDALESPLRVAFEQHLADCELCRAKYEKFNAAIMMLEELPEVETPLGLHAAVMARVEQARRTTPRRVRWWSIDWERVFTVRVPARAAAMGLAVLLLLAVVVQLTPLNTITAGLLGPSKGDKAPVSVDNGQAPSAWGPWGANRLAQTKYQIPGSGVSISVMVSAGDSQEKGYGLRFETQSEEAIPFSAYLLPGNASGYTAAGRLIRSGSVSKSDFEVIPVNVARSGAVAKVTWQYKDRSFSEFVFLPADFDLMAWNKDTTLSYNNASSYEMLKDISSSYGVVLLASGDLSKKVSEVRVLSGNPDDALHSVTAETGLNYRALAPSIYLVKP